MKSARATSFGGWAAEYHDWRPTYPDAAVDWLTPPVGAHVAEIGAGTGKLTDRLVERGLQLDVVEPDGRMLELVRQRHPRLRTHEAGADDLPLADASVDAVLVADAWHWFPKGEAAAEVARVLRPNGWLGCVWNVPVLTHGWEWQALRLDPKLAPPADLDPLDRLGLSTGAAEQRSFRWTWTLTPQQWRGFVSTVSHVRLLPEDECGAALDETERLARGRARLPGRRPCHSRTTRCACAGSRRRRSGTALSESAGVRTSVLCRLAWIQHAEVWENEVEAEPTPPHRRRLRVELGATHSHADERTRKSPNRKDLADDPEVVESADDGRHQADQQPRRQNTPLSERPKRDHAA